MSFARRGEAASGPDLLFIRDDDAGELTRSLEFFVRLFAAHRLPVSYQVIPGQLTEACAAFLREMAQAEPDLIELGQHGLHHRMDLNGRSLKREFGPERSYAQQKADIDEGLRLMRAHFGQAAAIDVFTPPQHKFDRNTVRAAAAAGHRVFSAASYATGRHRLAYALGRRLGLSSIRHHGISYNGGRRPEAAIFERSIAIAVDDGRGICCGADELPAAIAAAARQGQPIGLMFHHAVYADAAGRQALEAIATTLAGYGPRAFRRLSQLAPAPEAGAAA